METGTKVTLVAGKAPPPDPFPVGLDPR